MNRIYEVSSFLSSRAAGLIIYIIPIVIIVLALAINAYSEKKNNLSRYGVPSNFFENDSGNK
ncbi:MAG: hypothetical protein GY754_39205 [bacterium]|nr:hypothetical protein [bacterium]